jgi:hypothetical protein
MHIVVVNNIAASTEQTRAYAEYRVFASLAPYSRVVLEIEVCLGSDHGDATHVLCSVKVQTASGKGIRIRADATPMTRSIGPLTGLASACGSTRPLRKPAHSRCEPDPAIHLLALLETPITPARAARPVSSHTGCINCGRLHCSDDVRCLAIRA